MTVAWTDEVTLIPLIFRHLSSQDKKNRFSDINLKIDKCSCGYKARQQAISSASKVLIEMLRQVEKNIKSDVEIIKDRLPVIARNTGCTDMYVDRGFYSEEVVKLGEER